jgi:shikimate kinase
MAETPPQDLEAALHAAYYGYAPLVQLDRPVVVIGAPGAGAVAVCNALASVTGLPLIDLMRRVEHDAGKSAAHIQLREGERMLRAREAALLLRALGERPPALIACGPWAWQSAEVRRELRARARTARLLRPLPALVEGLTDELRRSPACEPAFMGRQPVTSARLRELVAELEPAHATAALQVEIGELHATPAASALAAALGWAV